MITSISSTTHAQPVAQSAPASQPAASAKAQPAPTDTVQIGAAAQALKEAIENPAQTTREAASGDNQAKRLLAREAADKAL